MKENRDGEFFEELKIYIYIYNILSQRVRETQKVREKEEEGGREGGTEGERERA